MFDADHNKSIINGELRSAPNEILISIADDSLKIHEAFEEAVIQVETALRLSAVATTSVVEEIAVIASTAKFAAKTAGKKIDNLLKDLALANPSTVSSGSDFLSDESQREQKNAVSKKKSSRRKLLLRSSRKKPVVIER